MASTVIQSCLRLLPIEAIESGDLTLKHVPPESMGGKAIALTCKACNNTAGHTVDAAVHGRERFLELGRGLQGQAATFSGPVQLDAGGVKTNATLVLEQGSFRVVVRESRNHPERFRRQRAAMPRGQSVAPTSVKLGVQAKVKLGFDRARVRDLRSAFLAAFAQFGYRYAYNAGLETVRQQILHPDDRLIDGAWYIAGPEYTEDPMMVVMTKPFPALLVRLTSVVVALPWYGSPVDFYAAIRAHFAQRPAATMTLDILEWPKTMEMILDFQVPASATGQE